MKIKIPRRDIQAVADFASMSEHQTEAFFNALSTKKHVFTKQGLVEGVPEVTNSSSGTINGIVQFLCSLYVFVDRKAIPLEDVAPALVEFLKTETSSEAATAVLNPSLLEARILRFLSLHDTVGITAKSIGVMSDNDRNFRAARIVSEVRPVFAGPLAKPGSAVLVHMLNLTYSQDGETKSFRVALDSSDIAGLKDILSRAQSKESLISENLHASGIKCVSAL